MRDWIFLFLSTLHYSFFQLWLAIFFVVVAEKIPGTIPFVLYCSLGFLFLFVFVFFITLDFHLMFIEWKKSLLYFSHPSHQFVMMMMIFEREREKIIIFFFTDFQWTCWLKLSVLFFFFNQVWFMFQEVSIGQSRLYIFCRTMSSSDINLF